MRVGDATHLDKELLPGDPLPELPITVKKEQFSLAYVHMVASAAGCSIKDHKTDVDGVDITIASSAEYEVRYCPQFELQLKCTSQARALSDDHISWQMEAGPFRRLTHPKRHIPAFLGVLFVPAESEAWLDQDEDRLLIESRMYWSPAQNLGKITDSQNSKVVRLPRSNLFDVDQLLGIMSIIGDGGSW